MDAVKLSWSSGTSLTSTTYSTKFRNDHSRIPNPPIRCLHISNRSSNPSSKGLQKNPKKDLSRILRTDAAIRNIERKANSKKYNRLWPKAVLEALDEAIRNNFWETALKVGFFYLPHKLLSSSLLFFDGNWLLGSGLYVQLCNVRHSETTILIFS